MTISVYVFSRAHHRLTSHGPHLINRCPGTCLLTSAWQRKIALMGLRSQSNKSFIVIVVPWQNRAGIDCLVYE